MNKTNAPILLGICLLLVNLPLGAGCTHTKDGTHVELIEMDGRRMVFKVEAHDEIEVAYEGDPFAIGFNANYLLEVLRYVGTDEIRMGFKAPERAATVEPIMEESAEAADYLCLVMPLRLVD